MHNNFMLPKMYFVLERTRNIDFFFNLIIQMTCFTLQTNMSQNIFHMIRRGDYVHVLLEIMNNVLPGPYTGGEVGVVSHPPPTGKQPGLVPPCVK